MKAIIGLGNFGLRYRDTRHNLGFLVIERLAKKHRIKIKQKLFHCLLGVGLLEEELVLLAQPQTFVNLSGQAAREIVKQKKIALPDLLVVCDDINLPLGKIRLKADGSDGGHKGLRSIITALGKSAFARLRIGIGRKKQGGLSKFVLARFPKAENKIINQAQEQAVACIEDWVALGINAAMNKFN
ncbi:MAG: aminoacyl-tRNA hydrolase [Candidatus Omnitrophica bacterium]|nr:aminoacyl-tRNA hydrolase [Candidatus Omnitrophota bacterium]